MCIIIGAGFHIVPYQAHFHIENLVVKIEDGKPKVRVIDFDRARTEG